MTIDANSRLGLPADARERAFKVRQARMAEDERRIGTALDALSEYYRSERVKLLGAEQDRLLREFTAAHRQPAGTGSGPAPRPAEAESRAARQGTAAFAEQHNIDLGRLDPLHAETQRRYRRIAEPQDSAEVEVTQVEDADASADKTFTSFGSWDAGGSWSFSNSAHWLERYDSHFLPAWNRSGSHIRMHMWNTDNRDRFNGDRNNGYLVEYHTSAAGQLKIELDVTCAYSEHELNGDDEWGISDCHASTLDRGLVEVYSGWDDWTPDSRNFSWKLSPWFSISGAVHAHHFPVPAGLRFKVQIVSGAAFPAGQTLLVYAATHQSVSASVNDTSVMASINAAWYVNSIKVF